MYNSSKYILVALAIVILAGALALRIQHNSITTLERERDKYKANATVLFGEAQRYKVLDSLNAARVESLELTIREFERFRADDAALIEALTARNRTLAAVNKAQSQTIIDLRAVPRDTVVIIDSVRVPAVAVHCGDAWFDFDGLLTATEFSGILVNRDSLILAESIKYKRFLGFLWKTHRVQDRRVDVVSKNPHTQILNVEHIILTN